MFKHILVPIDGGELSDAAVKRSCAIAAETGARLTFYHAKPSYLPPVIAGEGVFNDASAYEAYRARVDKEVESILQAARQAARDAGVACATLSTECQSPYEGIIAAAESQDCDLIFMASHGRRGMGALLLGSETQKVLTHCRVPVLVYR